MLDEKKVKLMTKIAIYEKNEGKDMKIASKSFKVDYVTLNMLYTGITTTIGYVLMVVLYVLSNLENLLVNVSETDFPKLLENVATYYVVILILFLAVSLVFYSNKYDRSFEKVRKNYQSLKSLSKLIGK